MRHAHLLEIRKLQLAGKSLVHKGVDFLCPKCSKTHLRASLIPKISRGTGTPVKEEGRGG